MHKITYSTVYSIPGPSLLYAGLYCIFSTCLKKESLGVQKSILVSVSMTLPDGKLHTDVGSSF